MITIRRKVQFRQVRRSRKKQLEESSRPDGRMPRVARLMALAIRFDQMIRDGIVADQAELARLGHVTRARLTQIMNLLSLAPDIQDAILFLPNVRAGREQTTERVLRPIVAELAWENQKRMWNVATSSQSTTPE